MLPFDQDFLSLIVDRSNKFYALKFKALSRHLEELLKRGYFYSVEQNIFSQLNKLKSVELITHGTDFFWLSIHRLYSSLPNADGSLLKDNIKYFLITAFDAFYETLDEGSFIRIFNEEDPDIPLVKLDLTIPFTQNNLLTLVKVSDDKIGVQLQKSDSKQLITKYDFSLIDVPAHHKIQASKFERYNNLTILYQKHPCLFEEEYYSQCNGNPIWGFLLKPKLERAFDTIKQVDESLFQRICSTVKYAVPLGNSDDTHLVSFSSAMLKNTIFLSVYMEGSFLIESIIHEFSHCELHYVQDTILLTHESSDNKIYYSPWRPDARPLAALIHGIYVFHAIAEFLEKLLKWEQDSIVQAEIRNRIELILNQIIIGIKQVGRDSLTEFSTRLLDKICESSQNILFSERFNLATPPTSINEHKVKWLEENKGLSIKE
jgi:hypothetical protein